MSSIKPYCKTFHFLNLRLAAGYNLTNSRQSDRRTLKARTTLQLREISQLKTPQTSQNQNLNLYPSL